MGPSGQPAHGRQLIPGAQRPVVDHGRDPQLELLERRLRGVRVELDDEVAHQVIIAVAGDDFELKITMRGSVTSTLTKSST